MIRDLLLESYSAMRHNRRRTGLTMLGMAWGIATVVLLLAYGAGFGRAIHNIFANWGFQIMGIFPGRTSLQTGGAKAGVQIRLTLEDVEHLRNLVPLIHHITPSVNLEASVQQDNRSYQFPVEGLNPDGESIRALKVSSGRLYGLQDEMQRARVAVLGSEATTKLFS